MPFLHKWEYFSNCVAADNTSDIVCRGTWAERDSPWNISPEARTVADLQPRYFVALLLWKTGKNAGSALRENAEMLSNDIGVVRSIITTTLRTHSSAEDRQGISDIPSTAIESTSALQFIPCARKYGRTIEFDNTFDRLCCDSLHDQRAGKRRHPGPHGVFLGPGIISQYAQRVYTLLGVWPIANNPGKPFRTRHVLRHSKQQSSP